MQNIELDIKFDNWKIIFLFGIIFSSILSSIAYLLVGKFAIEGLVFGFLVGGMISIFSILFITTLNKFILPKIKKDYWFTLAVIFSFLSGFCGVLGGYIISKTFGITILEKFEEYFLFLAILIGVLTYIIAALFYKLVILENKKELNERLLVESRLKSLERQLNPHFLFNSLNSLAELVHIDANKSEDMILKLSKFLRVSMKESALISLNDEVENVKRYVELENIRFSNRINLSINFDENLKDISIAKFSIQLLVENAIKHGYLKEIQNFKIKIDIFKKDNYMVRVSNNGKVLKNFTPGIGLSNLDERINLLCNGKVTLENSYEPTFLIEFGGCNENISS